MFFPRIVLLMAAAILLASSTSAELFLGQGTMSGEVTAHLALVQTRLTSTLRLDAQEDMPGSPGVVRFQWSDDESFDHSQFTSFQTASDEHDFIVRAAIEGLQSNTRYYYRAQFGSSPATTYNKFIHGKAGKSSGPLTATAEDKRLGFPAFVEMKAFSPDQVEK